MRGLFCWAVLVLAGFSLGQAETIDNASLIPKVVPDAQVQMDGMSPDWVKTLVMAEVRIETATPEGTFTAASRVLDHYAEMGVNGLWIDPIWERGSWGNGYGNNGIGFVEQRLTGAADNAASVQVVKQFVDEAHKRNIRVFFDTIVWGTRKPAPLVTEHPEFYLHQDGHLVPAWGGWVFDWKSDPLREWYKNAAVKFIEETGADGYRIDLAPDSSGYFYKEIRDALTAEGRKVALISEISNQRLGTFDFEETGVSGWTENPDFAHPERFAEQQRRFGKHNEYLFHSNIVDDIQTGKGIGQPDLQQAGKGGEFQFYTANLLNHDDGDPFVRGDRVRFAYSVLAPFIPLWWIGEEWNNPRNMRTDRGGSGVMYFNTIDWSQLDLPANRAFYEDAKRVVRVRRLHPEIFEQFSANARQANIVKLDVTRNGAPLALQAYARFGGGHAVLIVPNEDQTSGPFTITLDPAAVQMPAGAYHLTDLMADGETKIGGETVNGKSTFTVTIDGRHAGVYALDRD